MNFILNLLNANTFGELDKNLSWIDGVVENWGKLLKPLIIFFVTFGFIYSFYLGIKLATAPDQGKRNEAKKHIVSFVISMVVIVVFLLILEIFNNYLGLN